MKAIFLLTLAIGAILASGCSSTGNADSRGANLNNPEVARDVSTGSIAAPPEAHH